MSEQHSLGGAGALSSRWTRASRTRLASDGSGVRLGGRRVGGGRGGVEVEGEVGGQRRGGRDRVAGELSALDHQRAVERSGSAHGYEDLAGCPFELPASFGGEAVRVRPVEVRK